VNATDTPEPLCTYLDWDSDFFGLRIARANRDRLDDTSCKEILAWCAGNRIDCLYFLADFDDPETTRVAETHEFLLVDMRMTFERTLGDVPGVPSSPVVRPAREEDLQQLRAIASKGHRDTRFYFDRHFDRTKCDLLYETWVEKSFRGFAQGMLVAEVNHKPVAYVTGHLRGTEAQIGIVGVAQGHRGAGLGSVVVQCFLDWARREGAERATVVTQARNVGAQRLYQRNGFVTASCQLWYHRWFTF
jgi:dTDP-4-amino-4,6-dideoxy-D-galactose acyltransferase